MISVFPKRKGKFCRFDLRYVPHYCTVCSRNVQYIKPTFRLLNTSQEMKRNRIPLVMSKYATGNQCPIVIDAFHSIHQFYNRRYVFIRLGKIFGNEYRNSIPGL